MAVTRTLRFDQGVPLVQVYTWTTADGGRQSMGGWRPLGQARRPDGQLILDMTPYLAVVPDVADSRGDVGDGLLLSVPGDVTRTVASIGQYDVRLVDAAGGEAVRAVKLAAGTVTFVPAVSVDA